jgi:aminoglycoside 6'-N-acetyltransferase I
MRAWFSTRPGTFTVPRPSAAPSVAGRCSSSLLDFIERWGDEDGASAFAGLLLYSWAKYDTTELGSKPALGHGPIVPHNYGRTWARRFFWRWQPSSRWVETSVLIRPAQPSDAADWERMRQILWPSAPGEHAEEIAMFFSGDRSRSAEALLAIDESGRAIGFVELSIRPYAEGCYSGRVAYLEGLFVDEPLRRRGVGAALVKAAEEWGRAQGCTEIGSDAEIDNQASAAAHRALGFTEVESIICFRKAL